MNGAEALVRTLAKAGVDVCFANPGTSEMHFVAALDRVPGVRCVLSLFEGGATGAADGYARMADRPAATLTHLGTGLTNSLANVHNARKAQTPMVNIIGDHATYHLQYESPLKSDVEALARPMSHWLGRADTAAEVGPKAAEAIAAALVEPGQIASLILPADASWNEGGVVGTVPASPPAAIVGEDAIRDTAAALRDGNALVLLGGKALRAAPAEVAAAIAAGTGNRIAAQGRDPRIERGAGRVAVPRLPTMTGPAVEALRGIKTIVLVGSKPPVANFAHPGKPSLFAPEDCRYVTLATGADDMADALYRLADALGIKADGSLRIARADIAPAEGALTLEGIAQSLAALMPDNAILCDEAVTSGRPVFAATRAAAPHDYLSLTGGAIGIGLPLAAGAAVACPDRKVILLQADGSGLYTVQSLWTHASENLDILTIVYANNAYAILRNELKNVGIDNPGTNAIRMLSFDNPAIDWTGIARGFGVPAERVTSMEGFNAALRAGVSQRGPSLIEVAL
ncbi:acetolactate synthase large subunit [Chelatococcus asaccharovorans]|uniref:Acetolactate synthase-1/2/3 large subunit n=1 Tax=Chelatococcus asaccharovorans TaxID=28210 RepID=A0A2V3UWA2_9HYPH|nr:acetolactate synthase large subunit [Chelatococcus asaccharovorans]MBS7706370.1 acetolactate synthase large subunit [Chelatococcus asaccharovorans]PXW64988.1 acetolactate synthase-1/2/3 large subunit [Chelatococcus asaccharovorans]